MKSNVIFSWFIVGNLFCQAAGISASDVVTVNVKVLVIDVPRLVMLTVSTSENNWLLVLLSTLRSGFSSISLSVIAFLSSC